MYTQRLVQNKKKKIQSNKINIYKNWKAKILLGLDSSEDIPNFTNHKIS